jgi:hypothetical protein
MISENLSEESLIDLEAIESLFSSNTATVATEADQKKHLQKPMSPIPETLFEHSENTK